MQDGESSGSDARNRFNREKPWPFRSVENPKGQVRTQGECGFYSL
jgi:hypothetical protein